MGNTGRARPYRRVRFMHVNVVVHDRAGRRVTLGAIDAAPATIAVVQQLLAAAIRPAGWSITTELAP